LSTSWFDRLTAGFRKTSDRLGENLAGLFAKAQLDETLLDQIEEALIASDLGPATAAKVRARLAAETFETGLTEARIRQIVAEELEKILAPCAEPLEIDAFPRPQVILVIGVNGSGKTTTIAKLARLFLDQD
jgi:fused signal recognition particle receptor